MSNAKKTTAKKVVKKASARKAAAAPRPRTVIDEDGAPVDDVAEVDAALEAADVPVDEDTDGAEQQHTVDIALSRGGERTGATHPLRVRKPTDTQLVWFEAAAHRFDLAMEAWREGMTLEAGERGEVYNDALNAMNVFVATRHDRAWVSQAMASGIVELDAIIEGINAAKDVLGLGDANTAAGADVVVA